MPRILFAVVFVSALGTELPALAQEVTAEQFLRLIQAAHAPIRDVSFQFEGNEEFLGPLGRGEDPAQHFFVFEGRYAYRSSDGATLLELFQERGDNSPASHSIQTMLKGEAEALKVTPDLKNRRNPPVYRTPGGPGHLHVRYSPAYYVFLWRFDLLRTAQDFGFKFLGWEEIDGHRCLKIEFDAHPNAAAGGRAPVQTYWIDMNRGGHCLRIQRVLDGSVIMVTENIKLNRFRLPTGEEVWFPVRGETLRYNHEGRYLAKPTFKEVNYIVDGTLRLNGNLPDSKFKIDAKEIDRNLVAEPAARRPATAADLEQQLNEQLAEAESQARLLDASASAREEGYWSAALPFAFSILGVSTLGGSLFWLWRRR
ncbi:hypothetical protein BH23PLA1_BH23PLA1_27470 [soil metagenome]